MRDPPRVLILARLVPDAAELRSASAWLEERRSALEARGVVARAASFTSTAPGEELARLATELDVDLLLADAPDELLAEGAPDEQLTAVLEETPCDVALLVPRDATPEGPVLVPFGGAEHDWAAVELGAWFARADDVPLRLAGAAAVPEQGKRDASRLLSHGALAVQRVLGISAEPLLTPPGEEGMLEASRDAGLLVVGLSTRWHREGLGPARLRLAREATPPTLLVRRGLRPGGLAPPASADALHLVDSPESCSARAGRLVGPAGEELLPLLAGQRAVRERAARCAQDSGSMSQTAPWPLPWSQQPASVGGEVDHRAVCRPVSRGPICAPGGNVPERREGLAAETARILPSGLNSSVNAPPTFCSSSRMSLPVRTSQRCTRGSSRRSRACGRRG